MSYSKLNLMALKIQTIYFISLPTYKRARSSASVVDLVINFCLVTYYTIGLLNKLIKKLYKLQYIKISLVKLALEAAFRTWFILYSITIENLRVRNLVL